jgi:hypothetical protein
MALLPPIVAEFKANIGEFTSKVDEVQNKVNGMAKKGADSAEQMRQKIGGYATAIGGFATVAGGALMHFGEQMESAHVQLETAIGNAGGSFDEFSGRVSKAVSAQEKFGHTSADTQEALAKLTTATQDPSKALDMMTLAANVAAVKHVSLTSATDLVIKAMGGSAKAFKQFGIDVKSTADPMAELERRLGGQAQAQADTFGGKIEGLRARITDFAASLGEKVGPALTMLGPLLMGFGAIIQSSIIPTMWAWASSTIAAIWPYLAIAAAIAALVAGVIYAYNHFTWFRETVQAVAMVMTDYVWPAIKKVAGIIWDLIKIYLWPLKEAFELVRDGAVGAWNWIRDKWSTAVSVFKIIWEAIRDGFKQVESWIVAPFKAAFNAVAHLWNSTVGGFGFSVPSWVPLVGGDSFKIPMMPVLHNGGFVPGSGDVPIIAQGGEFVMSRQMVAAAGGAPTGGGGGRGGAVFNINVNVAATSDKTEIGREIVSAIRSYERMNSNAWRTQTVSS